MRVQYTRSFLKDYKKLPNDIQKSFEEKLELLFNNFHHPSLRTKKIKGAGDKIWEASVTMNYRLTFQLEADAMLLRRIGTHDILRNP